jgi:hypothetical protein
MRMYVYDILIKGKIMSLSSTIVIDKIEVLEMGQIQVRQAEIISKDGAEISRAFTRWVCNPIDDISSHDRGATI